MKDSLRLQLQRLAMRLTELDAHLADPQVTTDMQRYRSLAREQAEVAAVVDQFKRYEQREADLESARGMLEDAEMADMAREEIASAQADLVRLLAELQSALLPRDPDDARPAFLEIRAGTGGEESALFAADLARMYLRFC
jgi:peptide chain release factor 1